MTIFLLLSQQTAAKAHFGSGDRKQGLRLMRAVRDIRKSTYGSDHVNSLEAEECLKVMKLGERFGDELELSDDSIYLSLEDDSKE